MSEHDHEKSLETLALAALHASDDSAHAVAETDCAQCNDELRDFHDVAAELAESVRARPPFSLRNRILHAAFSPETDPFTPVDAYKEQITRLDSFLDGLTTRQWRHAVSATWSTADVVTHLSVIDELALDALQGRNTIDADVELLTAAAIAANESVSAEEIQGAWREQSQQVMRSAQETPDDAAVPFLGLPLTATQVVVDRAFETWSHAQDIRRALGHPLESPSPGCLALLTDLGARMLPQALDPVEGTARLVLRGDGGGSWLVPFGTTSAVGEPDVTITLDPIDFCLLIADRLDPDEITHEMEGNARLGELVLAQAPRLSRL